ncbi:MAG: glycosyl hydrolase family 18 protein [Leptospiraceae bacterium]|nr:glycosyl hydrolase family 18 protein [Leptospiraceae bacterium]
MRLKKFIKQLRTKLLYSTLILSWLFLSGFSFYIGVSILNSGKKEGKEVQSNNSHSAFSFASIQDSIESIVFKDSASSKEPGTDLNENLSKSNQKDKSAQEVDESAKQENEGLEFRASTWFSDYEAMKKTVHYYHEIHPFIYSMKGGLTNNGQILCSWSKQNRLDRVKELRALNPKVKIIPTIFRWENPKEKISENIGMNSRNDIRDKHIEIIIGEVETYGYDGIDIDYEGMSCNKKEKFEEFIVLLSKEMKKRNKILSIAVHPKTQSSKEKMVTCRGLPKKIKQDFQENWRGPTTHDYEFLAKHADRIKIMAYELHPRKYRNPGPGPQAPNTWIANIIEYAKTKVPAHKLYMAIPTYGYDWALNCKAPAKAVYFSDANRIRSLGVEHQPTDISKIFEKSANSKSWKNLSKFLYIHEDKVYEDPSLWYKSNGCDRVAFYMNRKAFEDKMNLLRKYNLGGFSFWQLLKDNDPGINDYLELLVSGKLPPVEPISVKQVVKVTQESKEKDENANENYPDSEEKDKTR